MFYAHGIAPIAEIVREIFNFFPPFLFTLSYGQIARVAGDHLESSTMIWAEGRDYNWSDLFEPSKGLVAISKTYTVPSVFNNL